MLAFHIGADNKRTVLWEESVAGLEKYKDYFLFRK